MLPLSSQKMTMSLHSKGTSASDPAKCPRLPRYYNITPFKIDITLKVRPHQTFRIFFITLNLRNRTKLAATRNIHVLTSDYAEFGTFAVASIYTYGC